MQLGLWSAEAPPPFPSPAPCRTAEDLHQRLIGLGLPSAPRFEVHRNRLVMLSWHPRRLLRIHEGYRYAPDEVLQAIVRFVTPGTRRGLRLEARRLFLAFPVDEHAPSRAPNPRPDRFSPGDRALVAELERLHSELNRTHFEGRLGRIPIRLSTRMRTRLGELHMERRTARPLEIGISRHHLRRDGWAAVRETLLHEMVHQWQAGSGRPVDHGSEFRRKARELGIEPRALTLPGSPTRSDHGLCGR